VKRLILIVVLLAVVVGSSGYAVAQARQPEAAYSTATATRADVERTLDVSGTIAATGRRDLGFGTSGKVSKVAVKAGQRVRKGQVLAWLDATALEADVTSAEATLARAKAQLVSDEDAQASAVTEAATNAAGGVGPTGQKPQSPPQNKPSAPSTPAQPDPALQQTLAELATGQMAVTAAQTAASEAIAAAKAALSDQIQKCQATSDDPDTTEAGETDDDGLSPACTDALAAVQEAQDSVAGKQDLLQTALTSLSETLTKAVTAVTKTSQPEQGSSDTPSGSQAQGAPRVSTSTVAPSSSADNGDGGASNGGTVTAARLAQDQADIDTANAQLGEAGAARGLATLRAPYAGRILQADLTRGDLTSSSDTPFVLLGQGVTTVTTTVTTAQVPGVRRGQAVTVTPAGWTSPMKGTVTAIGVLPDSSGNYPVTVTVESSRTVSEGSTASVSIVTAVAKDAVTVPTSALIRDGNRAVVRVLTGQTITRTNVTVGVVGTRLASITQGVKAGAKVVLADLAAEVPSSTSGQGLRNGPGGEFGEGPRVQFKER
jgi:HlyD family secretion protein